MSSTGFVSYKIGHITRVKKRSTIVLWSFIVDIKSITALKSMSKKYFNLKFDFIIVLTAAFYNVVFDIVQRVFKYNFCLNVKLFQFLLNTIHRFLEKS